MTSPFRLDPSFVAKYAKKDLPFGFNGLGRMVFERTYSRLKLDGTKETWAEVVERVVNGIYTIQKTHIEKNKLGWNEVQGHRSAEEMYFLIFNLFFLPPGRGLWACGAPITTERGLYASLFNCMFVDTANIDTELAEPFCFIADMCMLGAGVGFSTNGAGKITINQPNPLSTECYVVEDSREGWVEGLRRLLHSYFIPGKATQTFDFSLVRPINVPIKGFGGVASGPEPLMKLYDGIREDLGKEIGQPISITAISNIANRIGACVVAGNVRRSALLNLGDPDSDEFLNLKNYEVNPDRMAYGWTSNNTVQATIGMNYDRFTKNITTNGEPGFLFLDNMRYNRRMNGVSDDSDSQVTGTNPCAEIQLTSYEACNLNEVFIARHTSMEQFLRTLKFAYLYSKTITLCSTHWMQTNRSILKYRRIGSSVSGIAQFLAKHDTETLRQWLEEGYGELNRWDKIYSDWLCVPRSQRLTTIKPSGSVSLLAGATPGCHYPISRFYIRRVRLATHSDLLPQLQEAGYHTEPDVFSENTMVVSFPIDAGEGVRTESEVSIWEQASLVAFLQRHWADNSVSCTITFDPETEGHQIPHLLNYFQYQCKTLSFLPRLKQGAYRQMPYEKITEEQYNEMYAKIKPLQLKVTGDAVATRGCDNDTCSL